MFLRTIEKYSTIPLGLTTTQPRCGPAMSGRAEEADFRVHQRHQTHAVLVHVGLATSDALTTVRKNERDGADSCAPSRSP